MANFRQLKGSEQIILTREDQFSNGWDGLQPGIYDIWNMDRNGGFQPAWQPIKLSQGLVDFEGGAVAEAVEKMDAFFSKETVDTFKELKECHKLGMLLHGPPGTGKSSCAMLIMKKLSEKYNAVCINATCANMWFTKSVVRVIRELQKEPIVVYIDEFEHTTREYEHALLPLMDGLDSVDGMVIIACTNFLEEIPERIRNRKGRIRHLCEIKSLPAAVYKQYLTNKMPKLKADVTSEFAYKAVESGITLDELKNAVVDYKINGLTIDEAIKGVKI